MRRLLPFVLLALLSGLVHRARASEYPKPSVYPIAWELKFEHSMPKRIVVSAPGKSPVAYWYTTYTVTNDSGQEQVFLPDFQMVTDDGKIIRSDRGIPQQAFDAIKAQEKNKFLEPSTKITGEIRLGEAEAREGVAIWAEPKARMGAFKIFVGGLSGEFVQMKDKAGKQIMLTDDKGKETEPLILRKTLELNYHINGDEVFPGEDVVSEGENKVGVNAEVWVMR
jgi:hypothetical protein